MLFSQLRKLKRLDYLAVVNNNSGVKHQHSRKKIPRRWSTDTLFDVQILDQRVTLQKTESLVHYIGWPHSFDEWREIGEIVERDTTATQDNTSLFFRTTLITSIQEKLNLARKRDSQVTIKIPIQEETFTAIRHIGKKINCSSKRVKYQPKNFENFLEFGWWYRISNSNGDFAYVKKATLTYYIYKRRVLKTFSKELKPTCLQRGFMFVLTFVKGTGNKTDMDIVL